MFLFFHHQIACLTVRLASELEKKRIHQVWGKGNGKREKHTRSFLPPKGTVLRLFIGEETTCNYRISLWMGGLCRQPGNNQLATPQNVPLLQVFGRSQRCQVASRYGYCRYYKPQIHRFWPFDELFKRVASVVPAQSQHCYRVITVTQVCTPKWPINRRMWLFGLWDEIPTSSTTRPSDSISTNLLSLSARSFWRT